jgi:hypothetical protein
VVIAMIETPTALSEVVAICATPGLDGVYVGPSDLSLAVGGSFPMDPAIMDRFEAAVTKVRESAGQAGIHTRDGDGIAAARGRLHVRVDRVRSRPLGTVRASAPGVGAMIDLTKFYAPLAVLAPVWSFLPVYDKATDTGPNFRVTSAYGSLWDLVGQGEGNGRHGPAGLALVVLAMALAVWHVAARIAVSSPSKLAEV